MAKTKRRIKDDRPLSEKHPRLNLLLGWFMLISIVLGCVEILQYIAGSIVKLVTWVLNTVSKLDAVIIVALITGTISIIGIVLSSIVAKALEYRRTRREYLNKKREEPYGEFIDMIYKLQRNSKTGKSYTTEEMVEDMMSFSQKITLWGSPRVVNDWVKFKENALKGKDPLDNLFLTEQIMNDMRKDLGLPKTKKGNLLAFFVNDIKDAMRTPRKKS